MARPTPPKPSPPDPRFQIGRKILGLVVSKGRQGQVIGDDDITNILENAVKAPTGAIRRTARKLPPGFGNRSGKTVIRAAREGRLASIPELLAALRADTNTDFFD